MAGDIKLALVLLNEKNSYVHQASGDIKLVWSWATGKSKYIKTAGPHSLIQKL